MNTEQLKTFLALVETKNFSRCAKAMFVAQSTISKRISELEKEMGEMLFVRQRTGVRLTAAGKILLDYAEKIVNMEENAKLQVRKKSQYDNYLIIGSVYAYYTSYLVSSLPKIIAERPNLSVQVKFGHSSRLINQLKKAAIDVAFTHHAYNHPDYICQKIQEDEIILIADGANQQYRNGISHDKINELPFISSNFLYTTTHNWLFPRSRQFPLEIDIGMYAIPLIKDSQWYTITAKKLVEGMINAGELSEIPICDTALPKVEYFMIYHKDNSYKLTAFSNSCFSNSNFAVSQL